MSLDSFPFSDAGSFEEDWTRMARWWRQDGVLTGETNEFEVFADDTGMQVKVKTGSAFIKGFMVISDAIEIKAIASADPTNPRIDRVALKLDKDADEITIEVVTGTPAGSPVAPPLVDTSTVNWLALAQVAVAALESSIEAGMVTDERTFSYSDVLAATFGSLQLATGGEVTISSGELTLTPTSDEAHYTVDTEADAASDELDTINGGADGYAVLLRPENDARNIVVTVAGNISTPDGGTITLRNTEEFVMLRYDSTLTKWEVIAGVFNYKATFYRTGGEKTISSGAISIQPQVDTHISVDTESDAATDDLATINGGEAGAALVLRQNNDARDVTLVTSGNITTPDGNSIRLIDTLDYVLLRYDATLTKWEVVGGSYPLPFALNIPMGDGNSDIETGVWDYYEIPFDGVITTHRLVSPVAVTISLDAWLDTYANYPPTDADSIYSGNEPALSAASKDEDATLDIALTKGDWLGINVDTNADATKITLSLSGYRKR